MLGCEVGEHGFATLASELKEAPQADRAAPSRNRGQGLALPAIAEQRARNLAAFAQFEREVTAERIRDKIAASKKKGLWMGGAVSLGYDVRDKQLVVNPQEAETVRHIYRRYLKLGSIPLLQQALAAEGIRSKHRHTRTGRLMGGTAFGRGALYTLLSNPLYRGRVRHKDKTYPGQHEAIVDKHLWEGVQKRLADNRVNPASTNPKGEISLLAGLIVDEKGERLTPSHAVKKGKRYRYYLSAALTRGRKVSDASVWRLPAKETENFVRDRLLRLLADPAALREALPDPEALSAEVFQRLADRAQQNAKAWNRLSSREERQRPQTLVTRIRIGSNQIEIDVSPQGLIALFDPEGSLSIIETNDRESEPHHLVIPARLCRRGMEMAMVIANGDNRQGTDDTLVRLLARAYDYQAKLLAGNGESLTKLAAREGVTSSYVTRLLRLSYLAPKIVERILEGRQPRTLTAAKLLRLSPNLPQDWTAQRERILGENGPD